MGLPLKSLTIRGFKSIEAMDGFALEKINVLIGANGAGKTNFVDFFRLLRAMADERLQSFVHEQGTADGLFFLGPKRTPQISCHLEFGANEYEFVLGPTAGGSVQVQQESVRYTGGKGLGRPTTLSWGSLESGLKRNKDEPSIWNKGPGVPWYVYEAVSSWTVYHFHDTSPLAPMRREQAARDFEKLRHDASNVAAYLLHMRDAAPGSYALIRDTVRLIAPFFDDFLLRPELRAGQEFVRLEWHQRGSDFPFQPSQLSDGTIRFICLATALLQPKPPATVLIDEPELGLHPYAIKVLAELIRSAGERAQLVISTQSPTLLDHFEPKEIVVVNRSDGASTFARIDSHELGDWLETYSVGELWQKDVVRGGPSLG